MNGGAGDVLEGNDDGSLGHILGGGRLGFRQMRGWIANDSRFRMQRVLMDK